jgi:hypothetical protein
MHRPHSRWRRSRNRRRRFSCRSDRSSTAAADVLLLGGSLALLLPRMCRTHVASRIRRSPGPGQRDLCRGWRVPRVARGSWEGVRHRTNGPSRGRVAAASRLQGLGVGALVAIAAGIKVCSRRTRLGSIRLRRLSRWYRPGRTAVAGRRPAHVRCWKPTAARTAAPLAGHERGRRRRCNGVARCVGQVGRRSREHARGACRKYAQFPPPPTGCQSRPWPRPRLTCGFATGRRGRSPASTFRRADPRPRSAMTTGVADSMATASPTLLKLGSLVIANDTTRAHYGNSGRVRIAASL